MSAEELVQYLTYFVYCTIFVVVLLQAIREPRRANINIALFFSLPAFIAVDNVLEDFGVLVPSAVATGMVGTAFLAISYLLLRLVADFAPVPRLLVQVVTAYFLLLVVAIFVIRQPWPGWLLGLFLLFFVSLQLYAAAAFVRASRRASGVTRRRMHAVAVGSLFLALTLVFVILGQLLGRDWSIITQICALASGVSYFLGFAPPHWLRRAWQEPELRAFLGRAAQLPRLPTTEAIVQSLERGAATALGAPNAGVGQWIEEASVLRFVVNGVPVDAPVSMDRPTGKVFLTQRPHFVADLEREYPDLAEASRAYQSQALLLAPITAGDKRLGVLSVYAPRAPIFASHDLELVQLLADQAAVILESRSLIDEAARVQAREEATRLKDDFLSAAAHDLKTPLSILIGRGQLLERRALRKPDAPADLASIQTIVREAERLRNLVLELLDASRAERGQLVGVREHTDLTALAQESCARMSSNQHSCVLDSNGPIVGEYDRNRISQLIDNLVENAVKYSPAGGNVVLKVWREDSYAHLSVSDQGIGIPAADLPHIFDRFYRAKNVDDRSFAGMGLGLFICRAIAEQHGGRIWADANEGQGTTVYVTLPAGASTRN